MTREHSGISLISRAKQQLTLTSAIIRARSEDFELDYFRASTTERRDRRGVIRAGGLRDEARRSLR